MKVIALDVGSKRIGVAKADSKVRIAIPYGTFDVDGSELTKIASFARVYGTNLFVIGMPRNSQGTETAQSLYVRSFAQSLKEFLPDAKILFQDESLTSVEAERRLEARGKKYQKGDIDAEAAAIILQDFLENIAKRSTKQSALSNSDTTPDKPAKSATKRDANAARAVPKKKHPIRKLLITLCAILVVLGGAGYAFYRINLLPVDTDTVCPELTENSKDNDSDYTPVACQAVSLAIEEGQGISSIADSLANVNLIRNGLVFQLYYYLHYGGQPLLAGDYKLTQTMDVDAIIRTLIGGGEADVFQLTILPGGTLKDFQEALLAVGYKEDEIQTALAQNYDNPVLAGKPADTSLEGYLFGETYEFYVGAPVSEIINTILKQLEQVVKNNDLETAFATHKLNLYQGITLASIAQREAKSPTDQAKVAQVFYNRLSAGMPLGSDVTAKYAADLLDPDRKTYTDNAAVLAIDSPYNTRKYAGLPPGPICNPGEQALIAAAHPADTDYLYFLTGDDGVMYYSKTGAEHNQNVADHCQTLCNTKL